VQVNRFSNKTFCIAYVRTNAVGFATTHQSLDSDFKDLRKLCVGLMKDLYKRVELASEVVTIVGGIKTKVLIMSS
jgi:hypothetical protein